MILYKIRSYRIFSFAFFPFLLGLIWCRGALNSPPRSPASAFSHLPHSHNQTHSLTVLSPAPVTGVAILPFACRFSIR
jgi:hypothetical protein